MKQRAVFGLLFLGAIAAALFLRCGDLSLRPLHNDEAINAFKLRQLWAKGDYRYDPQEYHGPTLYYLSLPILGVASLFRPDQPEEVAMRAVPAVFGIGLVLLLGLSTGLLGRLAAAFAATLTAVSPAFVYYSRYYIHEILLVFFTTTVLVAIGRYRLRPTWGWAAAIGAGVGLMYATKETFVFAMAAAGVGITLARMGPRGTVHPPAEPGSGGGILRTALAGFRRIPVRHLVIGGGVAIGVAGLFFTSFLRHPGGALDALRTYGIWFQRAEGATPHVHPWDFYLERLAWFHIRGGPVWTEAGILLLAVPGAISGWWGQRAREATGEVARFLTGFGGALALVYAVIPYKTPWCLLGFYQAIVVLAGIGAAVAYQGARGVGGRGVTVAVVLAMATHLGWQAWRGSREFGADFRNPYVYGHTSSDIFNLLDQIAAVAASQSAGRDVSVAVVAPDDNYWPLPWYLRSYRMVGWWTKLPETPSATVMVVATKLNSNLEEKTKQAWVQAGLFELRPRYFVELYVEGGAWRRFLAARAAERR